MQKIVIRKKGGYSQLKIESAPIPQTKKGEVLVQAEACGVNFADTAVRLGLYQSADIYVGWPRTPGFEFAGKVASVGEGVTNWKLGDLVYGITRFGGYASHIVVPENQLFKIPKGFTPQQAAAFPAVYLTAFHALKQNFVLRPGMELLVHSAAGGVGIALVQLAKLLDCKVVAVVGNENKIPVAHAAGADRVVVRPKMKLSKMWGEIEGIAPKGFDAVFDANGISTFEGSFRHLKPTGKLVAYGFASNLHLTRDGNVNWPKTIWDAIKTYPLTLRNFNPLNMTNENKSLITFNLSFLFERMDLLSEGMHWLNEQAGLGQIPPPSVTPYPLTEAARAQQDIASGKTTGKLVLLP